MQMLRHYYSCKEYNTYPTRQRRSVEVMDIALEDLSTEVEGHPVLAPPPLTTLPDFCHAPPPFFNLEQLELIFELRRQMADQIQRDTLMHQRINMLYDAF
jgi:hypothetical protein